MAMRDEVMAAFGAVLERAKAAGAVREDVEPVDLMMLLNGIATVVSWVGPDHRHLHRRYLAVVLAGIRPRADDVALEPPAPTLEQIDAAMRALAARRPDG